MKTLVIGIAGTAKNTGKTTTLSSILKEIKKGPGLSLALTSIGYDGESFDNVTGLPKPRIHVRPGDLVAVSERGLLFSSAKLELIREAGVMTPMGKVVIGRVVKQGKLVLAGPNNRRELRLVLDQLEALGVDITIVDGALSRIAPMVEADALVLSTGASRCREIPRLAEESGCMADILTTPALESRGRVEQVASILNQAGFNAFFEKCLAADTVRIQGVIGEKLLAMIADRSAQLVGKHLVFGDPMKLLLAGEIKSVHRILDTLEKGGIRVGVEKQVRLLAVTVNPYFPKYRYNKGDYEADYVDKDELLRSITESVRVPCFDVVAQGGEGVFGELMRFRDSF